MPDFECIITIDVFKQNFDNKLPSFKPFQKIKATLGTEKKYLMRKVVQLSLHNHLGVQSLAVMYFFWSHKFGFAEFMLSG